MFGLPVKIIAVGAVRGGNSYFDSGTSWTIGFCWIFFSLFIKVVAIFMSLKSNNSRLMFQERLAKFESIANLFLEQPDLEHGLPNEAWGTEH
jgi:hypothetical protein